MSEANHSKQGLIRIMGLASAALMSLALLASASSNLNDDAGKSIWGGQIQQCGGKTATSHAGPARLRLLQARRAGRLPDRHLPGLG